MKFKRRKCRLCEKLALQNRSICWTHKLEIDRKKREDKLAKQAESKTKAKARHEQSIEGKRELMKKAWKVFSRYIRQKGMSDGWNACYCCDRSLPWEDLHASHFWHGRLDYDERNIHACCPRCNTFMHGNLAAYATRLTEELGAKGMKQLRYDAENTHYTYQQLREIIAKYSIIN